MSSWGMGEGIVLTWHGRLRKDDPVPSIVHSTGRAYRAGGDDSTLFYKFYSGSAPEKSHPAHLLQAHPGRVKPKNRGRRGGGTV